MKLKIKRKDIFACAEAISRAFINDTTGTSFRYAGRRFLNSVASEIDSTKFAFESDGTESKSKEWELHMEGEVEIEFEPLPLLPDNFSDLASKLEGQQLASQNQAIVNSLIPFTR